MIQSKILFYEEQQSNSIYLSNNNFELLASGF